MSRTFWETLEVGDQILVTIDGKTTRYEIDWLGPCNLLAPEPPEMRLRALGEAGASAAEHVHRRASASPSDHDAQGGT